MAERKIVYYKHYFIDFYNGLNNKAKEKVDYAIMLLKTQKTPVGEIEELAKRIKREYYENKQ